MQRYTDGLHVAAEQLLGPQTVAALDQADHYIPGLTAEPGWPTLRAHLLALAAETREHPLRHLLTAASGRDLETAGDMAAVLYWRLPELTPTNPGPLPWLPGISSMLHAHPVWGTYLAKRSQLVFDLAGQVQDHAWHGDAEPVWAPSGSHPSTTLIGEIAVWRAANGIDPQDPRPTRGGDQSETAPALWKQRLDRHIAWSADSSGNARFDERQEGRTAPSRWHDDSKRPYQTRSTSERARRTRPLTTVKLPLRCRPRLEVGSIASHMAPPLFDASETPWTPAARARQGTQLHWYGLVVHVVDHRLPVLEVVQEAVEVILLSCHGE